MIHSSMRPCFWILLLTLITNCSAPVSYINNVPSPSLLEQKGDLNIKANTGADLRLSDLIYDFDMAWSPIQRWGLKSHITTKGNENFYSKLFYADVAGVYYDTTRKGFGYELIMGYGRGTLFGNEFKSSTPNDHFPAPGFLSRNDAFRIENEFSKFFIQPSVNYHLKDEENVKITTGIRLQFIDFDQYYYEKKKQWIINESLYAIAVDPFIASHYRLGHFGLNTTIGYSLNLNNLNAPEYEHPVYKRFYYSIGIYLNLQSKSN